MKDYSIIATQNRKVLVKGPFNEYFVVPKKYSEDERFLEDAWANGDHIDIDTILSTLIERHLIHILL